MTIHSQQTLAPPGRVLVPPSSEMESFMETDDSLLVDPSSLFSEFQLEKVWTDSEKRARAHSCFLLPDCQSLQVLTGSTLLSLDLDVEPAPKISLQRVALAACALGSFVLILNPEQELSCWNGSQKLCHFDSTALGSVRHVSNAVGNSFTVWSNLGALRCSLEPLTVSLEMTEIFAALQSRCLDRNLPDYVIQAVTEFLRAVPTGPRADWNAFTGLLLSSLPPTPPPAKPWEALLRSSFHISDRPSLPAHLTHPTTSPVNRPV
jgi:hypothetical protein